MAFPSLTKTWHSEAYPAIAPSRPELSAQGKIVVITGGGGSIGGAIALAFAQAGAQGIAIIGRRNEPLQETRKKVESEVPGARIITVSGDLSDANSMKDALQTVSKQLGPVNVLVANAGFLPHMGKIDEADPDEWWTGFETNTKGAFNTCRALLPVAAPDCLLLDISTCVVHLPAMITASGYVSSKLAGTKVYETFAAENPGRIQVIHIHPGVVYSELNVKSGVVAADNGKTIPSRQKLTA